MPENKKELLERALSRFPDAVMKKMFGGPAYFINNNMFTAAHQENIILRLAEKDRVEILKLPGVVPFTPRAGMTMREYVSLPPEIYESEETFHEWLKKSWAYVNSLPVKEKKKK